MYSLYLDNVSFSLFSCYSIFIHILIQECKTSVLTAQNVRDSKMWRMWEALMYLRYSSVNGKRSTRVKKCYQKIWLFVVVWSLPTYRCCQDLYLPGWKCTVKLWSSGHIMVSQKLQHERIYAATAVNRELSKTKNEKVV